MYTTEKIATLTTGQAEGRELIKGIYHSKKFRGYIVSSSDLQPGKTSMRIILRQPLAMFRQRMDEITIEVNTATGIETRTTRLIPIRYLS